MTNQEHAEEKKMTVGESDIAYVPVTFDRCDHIDGPFYHGTKSTFEIGDQLVPDHGSNFHEGRTSNNIYFSALVETAVWGAELATARSGSGERGHIYTVEPTGLSRTTQTSRTRSSPATSRSPTAPAIRCR